MAISPLIHRWHTLLTMTVNMTLFLALIFLINLAPASAIMTISYNGWIMRYPSRILMSSSSITCWKDLNNELCLNKEDDMFNQEILNNYAVQVDTDKVAANQKQLNVNQLHELQHLLAKNKKSFDRSLGVYPHQKVCIDLLPGSKPVHHCAYLVPWAHKQTSKKNPTYGWYWNSWRMQSLRGGLALLHFCQKR